MPPPSPVPLLALAARVASSSYSTAAAAAVRAVPPAAASSLPTSVGGVRSFFSSYAKPWEAEGAPAAGNGEGEEEVLNRAALVAHLAETHDLTKAEGGRILDTVLDSITEVRAAPSCLTDEGVVVGGASPFSSSAFAPCLVPLCRVVQCHFFSSLLDCLIA